ncbi:hypothetical protein HYFRA_00005508 [Hymenoscyphus fraxineus]|uniref:Fucose-specific lectin n=1 Tax=Hymenoscyphus fraxineus TaxID=746836 RepID=A0A9N9KRK6_9HELO|nr:hypothetical protein HYFRA_00005508 [Hymenoscyphus fraxineus]
MSSQEVSTLEPVPFQSTQPDLEASTWNTSPACDKAEPTRKFVGPRARKFCGLPKKIFIIVTSITTLLILGAIVGGAVGGTRGEKKMQIPPLPLPVQTNTTSLLHNSSLAAVSWTDSHEALHRAVFYQNTHSDIYMSSWDAKKQTWKVSQVIDRRFKLPAATGTSIAASVNPSTDSYRLTVYYYSAIFTIMELYTEATEDSWEMGSLSMNAPMGLVDSKLAAAYQYCTSSRCANTTVVVYQLMEGTLQSATKLPSAQGWNYTPFNDRVSRGTGIALLPFPKTNSTEWDTLKVFTEKHGAMQEYTKFEVSEDWTIDPADTLPNFSLASPAKIAATALPVESPNEPWQTFVVSLDHQRRLQCMLGLRASKMGEPSTPVLSRAFGEFDDVALDRNQHFYGISGGKIYEYEISLQNPWSWNFLSVVDTTMGA